MIIEKTRLTMHLTLLSGAILAVWGLIQLAFSWMTATGYFQPGTDYFRAIFMGFGLAGLSSLLIGLFFLLIAKDLDRGSEKARKYGIMVSVILFVLAIWILLTGPILVPIVGADPIVKVVCCFLVLVPLIRYKYYFNW